MNIKNKKQYVFDFETLTVRKYYNCKLRLTQPFPRERALASLFLPAYLCHCKSYCGIRLENKAYSLFKLLTGFINAAFTAWKLTVARAITIAIIPAITNTYQ